MHICSDMLCLMLLLLPPPLLLLLLLLPLLLLFLLPLHLVLKLLLHSTISIRHLFLCFSSSHSHQLYLPHPSTDLFF